MAVQLIKYEFVKEDATHNGHSTASTFVTEVEDCVRCIRYIGQRGVVYRLISCCSFVIEYQSNAQRTWIELIISGSPRSSTLTIENYKK